MERAALQFAETVRKKFDFLTQKYGFGCTRCEVTFVRYESDTVFVNIFHGRSSYELGLEIDLLSSGEEKGFGLGSLIELHDPEKAEKFRPRIAYKYESVQQGVSELAALLQQYGDKALQGDQKTFEGLQVIIDKYWAERLANQIRPEAANAFRAKDYKKAAELYESIYNNLTEAELKKLKYAKSKLHKPS